MNQDERLLADALDRYITARQAGRQVSGPPAISAGEAALFEELLSLASSAQPSAESVAKTADSLRAMAARRSQHPSGRPHQPEPAHESLSKTIARSLTMKRSILLPLVGAAAVLILISIVVLPLINPPDKPSEPSGLAQAPTTEAVEPTSAPSGESPVAIATPSVPAMAPSSVPTTAPTQAPTELVPQPLPTAVPILPELAEWMGGGYGGQGASLPPAVEYTLQAELPAEPAQMTAYLQRSPEPLTGEAMAQFAARLGLTDATLYESGAVSWPAEISFDATGAIRFTDWAVLPTNGVWSYPPHEIPAPDQAIAAAQAFLTERGLLDFPFRTDVHEGTVQFFRLLPESRLLYGPVAEVYVRADGQVGLVDYRWFDADAIGTYPVISAQEAWTMVTSGEPTGRLWITIYPAVSLNPDVWVRSYAPAERADVFTSLRIRTALDPAAVPLITAGNLVLHGDPADLQALAQAHGALLEQTGDVESPVHIWGPVRDAGGYLALQLEGWETVFSLDPMAGLIDGSGAPYQWSGVVQRQGEQGLLLTDEFQPALNGLTFELPDLPADLAAGTAVYVHGGLMGQRIEWSRIQVRPADEGMAPPPSAPTRATVDEVELIYLAPQISLMAQTASPDELRVLMPVWSFDGQLDTGMRFRIWVQAVSADYLAN